MEKPTAMFFNRLVGGFKVSDVSNSLDGLSFYRLYVVPSK